MTLERAIEILNPEHREWYDSLETVEEACRMGMEALKKQLPKKPKDDGWLYCPVCNTDVVTDKPKYCFNCGQAIDWGQEDD